MSGTDQHTTGETPAFSAVVREYQGPLLRYAGRILRGGPADAQDVVQDAFVRLHRAQGNGEEIANVSSWLFKVTHNLALDAWRKTARHARLEAELADDPAVAGHVPRPAVGVAAGIARSEACRLAVQELDALPDEQRQVLLLRLMQNMTLAEISTVTGVKLGTVYYRLTHGLQELTRRLEAKGVVGPDKSDS